MYLTFFSKFNTVCRKSEILYKDVVYISIIIITFFKILPCNAVWAVVRCHIEFLDFCIAACCLSMGSKSCLNLSSMIILTTSLNTCTFKVNCMQNMKVTASAVQVMSPLVLISNQQCKMHAQDEINTTDFV